MQGPAGIAKQKTARRYAELGRGTFLDLAKSRSQVSGPPQMDHVQQTEESP